VEELTVAVDDMESDTELEFTQTYGTEKQGAGSKQFELFQRRALSLFEITQGLKVDLVMGSVGPGR